MVVENLCDGDLEHGAPALIRHRVCLVDDDGTERFELSPVGALVLAREGEVTFASSAMVMPRPADFPDLKPLRNAM